MTNSGTADYTVAGSAYFSDDAIQAYIDRSRAIARFIPLRPIPIRTAGVSQFFEYNLPQEMGYWIERELGSGDSGWYVKDGNGNALTINTDYTVNWDSTLVTFANDTKGTAYLLDARAYDLYAAAADIWEEKASMEMYAVDFQTDNANIKMSQRREFCESQAEVYRNKSGLSGRGGIQVSKMQRTDENWRRGSWSTSTAEPATIPQVRDPYLPQGG